MKIRCFSLRAFSGFFLAVFLASGSVAAPFDAAWIKGVTDKSPVTYHLDETIRFTLTVEGVNGKFPNEGYFLEWKRTGDDGLEDKGRHALSDRPFVYETKIGCPGFVRLFAVIVDKDGNRVNRVAKKGPTTVSFDGGAGVDISMLKEPAEPKDFDSFWEKQFSRLDLVPVEAERKEVKSPSDKVRVYAVSIACAGLRPVTGYLSIPKAAETGAKFPCLLLTHGYDGDNFAHPAPQQINAGRVVLDINAHGLKLPAFGATEADRKALRWECRSNGCSYAFDGKQNEDPETAYFNGMILRVKRALQYLKTLPEWNGRDLYAEGGSQGGLQTIWAAGCGEGVTRVYASIVWCCDICTNASRKVPVMHRDGWGDGWYISWTEAMGYYDAVNFAKRIPPTCRVDIPRAGLGDYCCPPMGLAKLWNALRTSKRITWVQGSEHGYVPPKYEGRDFVFEEDAR